MALERYRMPMQTMPLFIKSYIQVQKKTAKHRNPAGTTDFLPVHYNTVIR